MDDIGGGGHVVYSPSEGKLSETGKEIRRTTRTFAFVVIITTPCSEPAVRLSSSSVALIVVVVRLHGR